MKTKLKIILFLIAALLGEQYLIADNLVQNPSFENGTDNPKHWKISGSEKAIWAKNGATGKRSLLLKNNTTKPGYVYFYQSFKLKKDTQYRLSFRYRSLLALGRAKISIVNVSSDKNGKEQKQRNDFYLPCYKEFDAVAGAAGWTDYALVFNSGQAFITYVQIELAGEAGQKFWFDDFNLTPFWWKGAKVIEKCSINEKKLFSCSEGNLVKASKPGRIASEELKYAAGGLDAEKHGDKACFILASPLDKRWHGGVSNPDSVKLFFSLAPDADSVEIEVGYYEHKEVTRCFNITLDSMLLGSVKTPAGQYGSKDNRLKVIKMRAQKVSITNSCKHFALQISQADAWGKTIIDSIVIRGKGIKILSPNNFQEIPDLELKAAKDRALITQSQIKFKYENLHKLDIKAIKEKHNELKVWSPIKNINGKICRSVLAHIDIAKFKREFVRDREKSVDTTGAIFEVDAFAVDAQGLPVKSIGIEITYCDNLKQPALFYSWMGYHQYSDWELLKGSPSEVAVDFIGGRNDKKWKTVRLVIPQTPLTRLRAKNGKFKFKISTFNNELPVSAIKFFSLTDDEDIAWRNELATRRGLKYNLYFRKFIETRKRPALTKIEKKYGYIIQERPVFELLFPNSNPAPKRSRSPEFKLQAAPGETAISTFGFFPLQKLGDISVKINDLKSDKGHVIAAKDIAVKVVRNQISSYPAFYMRRAFLKIPYYLFDAEKFYAGFQSKWIWLIATPPKNAAAGVYSGQLQIATNGEVRKFPVKLRVLPIKLLESKRYFSMYPGYVLDPTRFTMKQIEQYLKHQKKYGMNASMLAWRFFLNSDFFSWENYNPVSGTYNVKLLDEMIKLFRKYDLLTDNRLLLISPKPRYIKDFTGKDRFQAYKKMIKAIEDEGKKRNWPELVWFPVDEPGEHNIKYAKRCVKIVKEVGGISGGTVHRWTVGQYGPDLDVRSYATRCFPASRTVDGLLDIKEDLKNKYPARQLMAYGQNWGLRLLEERSVSWWLWKAAKIPEKFTLSYWDYLHYWSDPYDNLDMMFEPEGWLRRDSGVGPSWSGEPVSTITWEEIRQGIIDLRYIYTLQAMIKAKIKNAPQAAAKAQKVLDNIKKQIPEDRGEFAKKYISSAWPALQQSTADFYLDYDQEFDIYKKWRQQIRRAIIELQKGKK